MPWNKVKFAPNDVSSHRPDELRKIFDLRFSAAGSPHNAVMLVGVNAWEDVYYFSPGAVDIAGALIKHYGGAECQAPTASEVSICVGNQPIDVPFAPERSRPV
jgi:hypothetical protein